MAMNDRGYFLGKLPVLVEAIKTFKNKNLKVEEKEERKKEEKGGL